jgi:hypothetical protein
MSWRGERNDSPSVGQVATELTFRGAFQFRRLSSSRCANSNLYPIGPRIGAKWMGVVGDEQQQMNTDSKTIDQCQQRLGTMKQ